VKVGQIMSEKVCCISSGKSVRYAANLMNEQKIGSLVVVDEEEVVGIITSRDIRTAHPNRLVADAMTYNPLVISETAFIGNALYAMEQHHVERLIVKDGNEMKGIITRERLRSTIGSYIDQSTHLYRSKYIEYIYDYLTNEETPFHLLFIDLNDFGSVNKKFGHAVGDDLLIQFSVLLKEAAHEQDYVCRYGGDEFVIITTREYPEVQELVDRLSEPMLVDSLDSFSISASIGVLSGYDDNGKALSYRECLSRASLQSTEKKQK